MRLPATSDTESAAPALERKGCYVHVPSVVRSVVWLCFVLQATRVFAALGSQVQPIGAKHISESPPKKPLDPLVEASNRFGAKLLAEIHRQNPRENVFISPASVALALGVAWSGARGETRQELARCLEIAGLGIDSVHAGTAGLLRSIHRADPGIELEIATSLWVAPGVTLRPDFIGRTAQAYKAQVVQLGAGDGVARINAWVREKTHGKIDAIVESLPPNLVLEILNAVYFRGAWDEEFNEKETREGPFHLLDGGVEPLMMMSRFGTYPYLDGPGFRAAALPYRDDVMRFYVALPDSATSLSELVRNLASEAGLHWMQQLESRSGEVVLPRLTLAYDLTMNEVLKKMGMQQAFGSAADFSGIAGGVGGMWISKVRHKGWVEVTEKGTEAAAVTEVQLQQGIKAIPKPFRFVVDRPFLLVIRDRMTGLVLFLGAVTHPQRL